MLFKPHNGYFLVQQVPTKDEQNNQNFLWEQQLQIAGDLIAVKILDVPFGANADLVGRTAVVFNTMVQKFEFRKEKWKIIPESAIIGFIEE